MKKYWIDYLRVLSCLAVVVIHVTAPYYVMFGKVSREDWWLSNILNASSRFAVPMFIMISGCLLLGKQIGTFEFYKKRAARLLPPLLFWTAAYIVFAALSEPGFVRNILYGLKHALVTGQAYYHLWYLSVYLCLMLFFPFMNGYFLGQMPSRSEFLSLSVAFSLLLLFSQVSDAVAVSTTLSIEWYTVFPWYFSYFVMGYIIDRNDEFLTLSNKFMISTIASLLALGSAVNAVIAGNYAVGSDHTVFMNNGIVEFVITVMIFSIFRKNWHLFKQNKHISLVADASFGIYLIHPMVVSAVRTIPGYYENGLLFIPFSIVVVFAVSYGAIAVLRRFRYFRSLC